VDIEDDSAPEQARDDGGGDEEIGRIVDVNDVVPSRDRPPTNHGGRKGGEGKVLSDHAPYLGALHMVDGEAGHQYVIDDLSRRLAYAFHRDHLDRVPGVDRSGRLACDTRFRIRAVKHHAQAP
jgi:hypothetical protein